jgi:hypothetical protein
MKKYVVEMSYILGVTLNVKAENKEYAIEKAKEIVRNDITVIDTGCDIEDVGDIEFEQVNFVKEVK